MKKCKLCKQEKEVSEFGGQNNSSNWCKLCWKGRALAKNSDYLNKRDNGDSYEALEKLITNKKRRKAGEISVGKI